MVNLINYTIYIPYLILNISLNSHKIVPDFYLNNSIVRGEAITWNDIGCRFSQAVEKAKTCDCMEKPTPTWYSVMVTPLSIYGNSYLEVIGYSKIWTYLIGLALFSSRTLWTMLKNLEHVYYGYIYIRMEAICNRKFVYEVVCIHCTI